MGYPHCQVYHTSSLNSQSHRALPASVLELLNYSRQQTPHLLPTFNMCQKTVNDVCNSPSRMNDNVVLPSKTVEASGPTSTPLSPPTVASSRNLSSFFRFPIPFAATLCSSGNTAVGGDCYWSLRNIVTAALASIPIIFIAFVILQGLQLLLWYRANYGNKMPTPVSPSHGVVVAMPAGYDMTNTLSSSNNNEQGNTNDIHNNKINYSSDFSWKTYIPGETHNKFLIPPPFSTSSQQEGGERPLRILVFGDSIARGVGQFASCTPLFPETMAGAISTAMNGRPVYWTAVGEPGSNAEWINKQVHERLQRANEMNAADENSSKDFDDNSSLNDDTPNTTTTYSEEAIKSMWERNLQIHKEQYDRDPFGAYDAVLILTGINDVKEIILPFMFEKGEAGFSENLSKIIEGIEQTMKARWEKAKGHVSRFRGESTIDLPTDSETNINGDSEHRVAISSSENSSCSDTTDTDECQALLEPTPSNHRLASTHSSSSMNTSNSNPSISSDTTNGVKPLIIFPRLPGEICPLLTLSTKILKWAGLQIFFMIERTKQKVVRNYPDHALVTVSPDHDDVEANILEDPVILSLTDVSPEDCIKVQEKMTEFERKYPTYHNHDLYSLDGVHPSDKGYKFFAQYVVRDILAEWKK